MSVHDPYVLPEGLPVPVDDGGADHLPGLEIPNLVLPSSQGPVDLAELAGEREQLQGDGPRAPLGQLRKDPDSGHR
jgi:hypothetical protein